MQAILRSANSVWSSSISTLGVIVFCLLHTSTFISYFLPHQTCLWTILKTYSTKEHKFSREISISANSTRKD